MTINMNRCAEKVVWVMYTCYAFSGEVARGDVCIDGATALSEMLLEDPPCRVTGFSRAIRTR